ncbi:ABC transporter permease [Myxococcota bacterium]|nr:ABC transporter permease [Myxococcota bacterium]
MLHILQSSLKYRYVLRNFVARDLKLKYRGSIAGYLWTLIEPMALVATYWFVFVVIAERGDHTYPLVVLLGVLPYNFFSAIVTQSSSSLVANASLIRRVYMPRELFIISLLGSNLVMFLLSLLVVIPFLVVYGITPGAGLLLLPPAIVLLTMFATGIGLVVSCLNVLYRDVSYVMNMVLRITFYGSPVIYAIDMVPERLQGVYFANPLAVYLTLVRTSVLGQPLAIGLGHVGAAVAIALLTFVGGALFFRRWEKKVVKFL